MPKPDPDVIERYFTNRCTPSEAGIVLDWLATPAGQAFYQEYLTERIEKSSLAASRTAVDEQRMLEGIYRKINSQAEKKASATDLRYRYWIAAAVVLLLSAIGAIFFSIQPHQEVVQTAYGETQRVVLRDGSTVVLNANSKISYATDNPREVWLEGEAFFQVAHASDESPFRVHTSDLTIRVLGTEFNVQTRRQQTDVVLRNGKVQLELNRNLKKDLVMKPGDKVCYSRQVDSLNRMVVEPSTYTSWITGTIVFDHTPLREVFQRIEDTYGIRITVQDSRILEREFTGEVVQDLGMMLTLLEKSFDLKATRQGDTVFLNRGQPFGS